LSNPIPDPRTETYLRQRQRARGFTEYFRVGDLVRFPLAVKWNRERDYRIKEIYDTGFEVETSGFTYRHSDASLQGLGITLSGWGRE
jgi:hypothetical protein